MRSAPARACWPTANSPASIRTGATSCTRYEEKARNVPSVIWPSIASQPPSASTATWPSVGDGLQGRGEPGLQPHQPRPRRVEAGGRVGQLVELAVLLAEALHDPHAGDRLVDHAGDLAGALLRVPRGGEHLARSRSDTTSSSGSIATILA